MMSDTISKIDNEVLKTIVKKIMIEEKRNLSTKRFDEQEMIKKIKKIIESELT
jgi:hypothetical protein